MFCQMIKTEDEYNIALERIDQLMDSEPGTLDFDELELLGTLVEIYEEENFPIGMPDPITDISCH